MYHHFTSCRRLIKLVNDKYDLQFSIKDEEHERRAAKYPQTLNVFPKEDNIFQGAAEFNKIMAGSANKVRLQKLVMERIKAHVGEVRGEVVPVRGRNLST